jgi:hypothetical protein
MRKGLRVEEELQIATMVGKGIGTEQIYTSFTVWPYVIDECIAKLEASSQKAVDDAQVAEAEMQANIKKGVDAALAEKAEEEQAEADAAQAVADKEQEEADAAKAKVAKPKKT